MGEEHEEAASDEKLATFQEYRSWKSITKGTINVIK